MNVLARALAVALLLGMCGLAWGKTINVPADYTTIQAAVNAAVAGDVVVLAAGSYKSFSVNKSITIRSTSPDNPTVVEQTEIFDMGMVFYAVNLGGGAVLDGLHITAADTGAVKCTGAGTVRRCQLTDSAGVLISVGGSSAMLIEENVFSDASEQFISCYDSAAPVIRNNYFTGNWRGAITAPLGTAPRIESNTFYQVGAITIERGDVLNNWFWQCEGDQAGAIVVSGPANIVNNIFVGCHSNLYAGAIYCTGSANIFSNTISDCTVKSPTVGGSIYIASSWPIIRNCIIAFSSNSGVAVVGNSNPNISYCDLYGNAAGNWAGFTPTAPGILSANPQFGDRTTTDYRLKSAGGRYNGSVWVNDTVSSPCIDAGDPASPCSLEPAPNGGRINMGYDGNTRYASRTPPPVITVCTPKGTGVSMTTKIIASFSTPMKPTTVQNAFYINGTKVTTGTFAWLGSKMTYTPATNWRPNKRYQVKITTAARSKIGVAMAADKIWNFTTGLTAPALLTATAAPTAAGAQISLNLTAAAEVTVSIRNVAGREIALLQPGQLDAGVHSLLWNAKSKTGTAVPTGTYLIEASARGEDGARCSAISTLQR